MSFLIRWVASEAGEIVHDETVVADVAGVSAIEKDVYYLGRTVTLRIEFDPALVPAVDE